VSLHMPMEDVVSAADANRRLSEILRKVRNGRSVTVTSRGKPVARIVPTTQQDRAADGARTALLARLRAEPVVTIGPWSGNELYED
jgi:prevent-host-death family protein